MTEHEDPLVRDGAELQGRGLVSGWKGSAEDPLPSDGGHMSVGKAGGPRSVGPGGPADRASASLWKLVDFINHQQTDRRMIDQLISDSAARCLQSHLPLCLRCGLGWMRPAGFVMCGSQNSETSSCSDLFSEPTLRCDHPECRFETGRSHAETIAPA